MVDFALVGLALGALGAALLAKVVLQRAGREALALHERARQVARTVQTRAAAARERDEARFSEEAAAERARGQQELAELSQALNDRENILSERDPHVAAAEARLRSKDDQLKQLGQEHDRLRAECDAKAAARLAALQATSGLGRAAALEQLAAEARETASVRAQRYVRTAVEECESEAASAATRVMAVALDRYNGVGHLEHIQNTMEIADPALLHALADSAGPTHLAFAEGTGCTLVCDEEARTATVRGDDPLAREIARRLLRQLANRRTTEAGEARQMAAQVKDEVEREVHNAGRKALRTLDAARVHPDILHLVGRLKFRLSYSQNQWKHAIEVGYLAGLIAEELGLDVALARRGGLLHDIGKAMTHEREGAHAVLGAEVARRCGESEVVANAIGSHHFDEPPAGPLAYVVTAADALSGARPGARRENAAHYLQHIRDLQAIAGRRANVLRVDVMHAGREVRVVVAGREQGVGAEEPRRVLTDSELVPLAREIARAIEAELSFAGQIRVTVIRESRAVALAY